MNPIKLILVDDQLDFMESIKHYLEEIPDFELLGQCKDGEELVEEVMIKKPDLVLTAINLPKKNGIQAIKDCRTFYPQLKVIFLTGFDEYAIEAFELSAIDYIMKPVGKARFHQALERARLLFSFEQNELNPTEEEQKIKILSLKDGNSTLYIPFEEIYFIEKAGKKCHIYTEREIYKTTETIGKILSRLDDSFIQAHRSNIINLYKVSEITPYGETYIVQFKEFDKQASISKLKIQEVRDLLAAIG